jgi:hypothetical protein
MEDQWCCGIHSRTFRGRLRESEHSALSASIQSADFFFFNNNCHPAGSEGSRFVAALRLKD